MFKRRFSKKKYKTRIICKELFDTWKKEHPEFKMPYIQWLAYSKLIMEEYVNEVITNTNGVRLPFYMGDLDLKFSPKRDKPVNIKETAESGSVSNHMNLVTNGRVGKIVWSCTHARRFNKFLPLTGFEGNKVFVDKAKKQFINNPELFRDSVRSKNNRKFNNI